MDEKELIESIERLGCFIGQVSELADSIRLEIKEKYGYHGYTVGILSICRSLISAEGRYTNFHTHFFKELIEK